MYFFFVFHIERRPRSARFNFVVHLLFSRSVFPVLVRKKGWFGGLRGLSADYLASFKEI